MTDDSKWSTEAVTGLLALYRAMPSLWKVKSNEHKNRNLRKECYDKLIVYCREIFPQADKEFVAKKIQRLRGAFRKEFNKVVASRRSGNGADEVYVPTLWYYNLLLFTKDQDTPSASVSNINDETSLTNETEVTPDEPEEMELHDPVAHDVDDASTQPHDQDEEVQPCGSRNKRPAGEQINGTKKKKRNDESVVDILKTCAVALNKPTTSKIDISEYEASGIKVAKQLARMDPEQAIYADSIIAAVLRKGLLKQLKPHTDICENECQAYGARAREIANFNNEYTPAFDSPNISESGSRSY